MLKIIAALTLLAATSTASASACSETASDAHWVAKITHVSTYPAGVEWNTETVLYANGCMKTTLPAMHKYAGVRWIELPQTAIKALSQHWAASGLYATSPVALKTELGKNGITDLHRIGAESIIDVPVTEARFRDPASGKETAPVRVYALDSLHLPKAATHWHALREAVRDVDAMAALATR